MSSEESATFLGFPIVQRTLANGLNMIFQESRRAPLVALQISYRAGSCRDPASRCGLAHLCEHLAFTGSRNLYRRNLPETLLSLGGVADAATWHDRTSYSSLLPAQQLKVGLWIEAERMYACQKEDVLQALEVQRKVLLQERLQIEEGRPYDRAVEFLHQLIFPISHPYHRPPAGTLQGIRSILREDVQAHFASYYFPSNAVLSIVGPLSEKEVVQQVEHFLGDVPAGPRPSCERPNLPPVPCGQEKSISGRMPTACIYLAYRGPGYAEDGWAAVTLLAGALAIGRSSPLQRDLVGAGLARQVSARMVTMKESSTIVFLATPMPGVRRQRLERAAAEALDRLLQDGVSAEALERARRKALTDYYARMLRPAGRAELLSRLATFQDSPAGFRDEADRYRAVELDDIRNVCRRFFQPDHRVILSMVPVEGET